MAPQAVPHQLTLTAIQWGFDVEVFLQALCPPVNQPKSAVVTTCNTTATWIFVYTANLLQLLHVKSISQIPKNGLMQFGETGLLTINSIKTQTGGQNKGNMCLRVVEITYTDNTKQRTDLLFSNLLSTLLKCPLLLICMIDNILSSTQQLAFHCLHKHCIIKPPS